MKTVTELGPYYTKLVPKFIVNLFVNVENKQSQQYIRVFVRGRCIKFSPKVINAYVGRSKFASSQKIPSLDQIAREIIGGKVKKLPKKSGIPTRSLNVKYAMLNIIGAIKWPPKNHKSSITSSLAKMIFQIGTKAKINLVNLCLNRQ